MKSVRLPVFLIEDEYGYFSAFCPALNISGQGRDEDSAIQSFHQVMEIFLEETTRKGTLPKILKELGWTQHNHDHRPPQTDIPSYSFTKREVSVAIPCP
jgi:predicted RNase H-like HicB family nuclease